MFLSRNCITIFAFLHNIAIISSAEGDPEQEKPIAETNLGKFEGSYRISRNGKYYSAFIGIPFARIEQRFETPQPIVQTWDGIINATAYGAACPQFNSISRTFEFEEDCLFLNVFTPDPKPEGAKRSVLVYIHGGAWFEGSGHIYGEQYFIDEDIVYVTINYRLGALGFLSTADGIVAGNMGQKDQVMALRWVQENIEAFGGDKNRVTISGNSAGASSVAHLVVSSMAADLFHGAAIQSGSALNAWSWTDPRQSEANAFELGIKLGCETNSTQELVNCLRKASVQNILVATLGLAKWHIDPIPIFTPTLELPKSISGKETFLEEPPRTLLDEGRFNRVPVIMTLCKDEGLSLHAASEQARIEVLWKNKALMDDLNQDWTRIAPVTLRYYLDPELGIQNEAEANELSKKIRNFYFGNSELSEKSLVNLTTMYSDRGFFYGAHNMVQLLAKNNVSTYSGIFTYVDGDRSSINLFGVPEILGVAHGDDTFFFFGEPYSQGRTLNKRSEEFSKYIVNMWANFVKNGIPTSDLKDVNWPKATLKDVETDSVTWLDLNNKNGTNLLINPFQKQNEFWDNVYNDYGVGRKIYTEGKDTVVDDSTKKPPTCTSHKIICRVKDFFRSFRSKKQ